MPLPPLTQAPAFQTQQQAEEAQTSTPASFTNRLPVLRIQLDNVTCRISPPPQSGEASNGAGQSGHVQMHGTLWVTDDAVSFLTPQGTGWTLDYPCLSLHAISRSLPDGLVSAPLAEGAGCLYCQTDDAAGEEGDEEEEEGEESSREMWLLPAEQEALEPLFAALSTAASLHPSLGGEEEASSHPFAGLGAFGTGASMEEAEQEGAFDDADDAQDAAAGLSEGGRKTLAHLEALLSGAAQRTVESEEESDDDDDEEEEEARVVAPTSPTASFHSSDPRRLADLSLGVEAASPNGQTNTLNIANLPSAFFEQVDLVRGMLDLLNAYGTLASYAPLPSFGRAIVVFERAEDAALAKAALDGVLLPWEEDGEEEARLRRGEGETTPAIRAYFGPTTYVSTQEDDEATRQARHLGVPVTDRNFLISPPGSPPVGWEPIREDPPNRDTLADDLIRALGALRDSGANVASASLLAPSGNGNGTGAAVGGGGLQPPSLVIAPTRTPAPPRHPLAPSLVASAQHEDGTISVPGVTVQSFDPDEASPDASQSATPRPKHSISSVKATIESMRGGGGGGAGNELTGETGQRIAPTGRPPLA